MTYRSLISIADLGNAEMEKLFSLADHFLPQIESGGFKSTVLKGTSTILLFFEPSTRTRVSFELAGKMLGSDTINISTKGSSSEKGESLRDTALTMAAMDNNIVVMRHGGADAVEMFASCFDRSVINAGAGRGQHPTQALLDAHSLHREGLLETGRQVAIVGDIKHSRVMRSNIMLLLKLGMDVTLVAPPPLMPDGWEGLKPQNWAADTKGYGKLEWSSAIDPVLPKLDVVMLLRMQNERMVGGLMTNDDEYAKIWGLSKRRLDALPEHAIVLHPGPVNRGVELGQDVFDDPRCRINTQVNSGLAVRCALLCWACGKYPEGVAV